MNSVILIGRLARDPDLSYTQSQMAVCKFTLAVDRGGRDKGADFISITVFDRQAENCDRYLSKGRQAAVHGRIQTGSYKNRDGQTVYTTDVIADRVEFIGAGGENSRSDGRNQRNDTSYNTERYEGAQVEFDGFSAADDDVPY